MAKNKNHLRQVSILDAGDMITGVVQSPEYQQNIEDGHPTKRALARAALELAGMDHDLEHEERFEPHSETLTRETSSHALLGTLPAFVQGLEAVDFYHKHPGEMDKGTYYAWKRHTARFNHTLKAMIERDPGLQFDNIVSTVSDLYGVLNRDRWGDDREGYDKAALDFKKHFEGTLRGMQQEVIARQVIEAINETDPRIDPQTGEKLPRVVVNSDVSVKDDMQGVDLYVTLDGVSLQLDIKASERTAQNARNKSKHPQSIITSGIPSQKLNGSFTVSPDWARRNAPDMLIKLQRARTEYMEQHGITEADVTEQHTVVLAA